MVLSYSSCHIQNNKKQNIQPISSIIVQLTLVNRNILWRIHAIVKLIVFLILQTNIRTQHGTKKKHHF